MRARTTRQAPSKQKGCTHGRRITGTGRTGQLEPETAPQPTGDGSSSHGAPRPLLPPAVLRQAQLAEEHARKFSRRVQALQHKRVLTAAQMDGWAKETHLDRRIEAGDPAAFVDCLTAFIDAITEIRDREMERLGLD